MSKALTESESVRFGRNMLLPEIGIGGQELLRASSIRLPSLDASGSAAALYLAAAGVGALVLEDARPVAPADLAGTLYRAADVGTPRAEAARRALAAFDPGLALDVAAGSATVVVDVRDEPGGSGPQALLAGSLAALETVKSLLGLGGPLRAEMLP